MQAADIMTFRPACIRADAAIEDAARLMLQYRISGLPVVDQKESLVGIVTEGDLLRRVKGGSGHDLQTVADVMTPQVVSVGENASVRDIVDILQRRGIKRVPVVKNDKVVGIVSRADLMRGLAQLAQIMPAASAEDRALRERVLAAFMAEAEGGWRSVSIVVHDGSVELRGATTATALREKLVSAARKVPGVKEVKDRLVIVGPGSGHM